MFFLFVCFLQLSNISNKGDDKLSKNCSVNVYVHMHTCLYIFFLSLPRCNHPGHKNKNKKTQENKFLLYLHMMLLQFSSSFFDIWSTYRGTNRQVKILICRQTGRSTNPQLVHQVLPTLYTCLMTYQQNGIVTVDDRLVLSYCSLTLQNRKTQMHTHVLDRIFSIGYSYTNTAGRVIIMWLFQLHPLPLTVRKRVSIINNRVNTGRVLRSVPDIADIQYPGVSSVIVQHWPYSKEAISDATESVLHLFVQQHMSVPLFFLFGCLWIFCEQLQNSSSWQQMIWRHDIPASNFWSFRGDFRMVRQSSVAFVHPRCFGRVWQALAEVAKLVSGKSSTRQKSCVQQ